MAVIYACTTSDYHAYRYRDRGQYRVWTCSKCGKRYHEKR